MKKVEERNGKPGSEDLSEDEEKNLDQMGLHGISPRNFFRQASLSGLGVMTACYFPEESTALRNLQFRSIILLPPAN